MIGLLLAGLGSAATAAGMGSLGAGLTAAGSAVGSLPGMGASLPGMPGMGGTPAAGPGSAAPGSMPFGFDITKMLQPAQGNLGTQGGQNGGQGESKAPPFPQAAQIAAPQSARNPVDVGQLLSIINSRRTLGS